MYRRFYYYVDKSNSSLIIILLFENWDFVLEDIEALVDIWGRSIVGDLENGGQAADEHVGRIFEAR